MVAQFLGLKLRLMGNAFRRGPWQVFGMVLAVAYGLVITVAVVGALIAARTVPDIESLHSILVVIGSVVVLGFALLPLLFGVDDALDPQKFALFGLRIRTLALGLLVSGLVGVPAAVLAVCSLATVVTWSRNPGSTVFAIVSAVAVLLTCVLASRVSTALAAAFLATRRSRDTENVLGVLLLVLLAPLVLLLLTVDWGRDGLGALAGFGSWLQWTPLGAAWSAPAAAAAGEWGTAALQLVIAVATLALLWGAWMLLVARVIVVPPRHPVVRSYNGLGWFGRIPGGPTAAIAARSATYWGRDPRYWVALVMIPVFPVVAVVALILGGLPVHAVSLVPLPLICLFLGWTVHNDVAFDSTAVWLHVVSGTRGVADRLGRVFPAVAVGIPVIAVGSVLTTLAYGDWTVLPSVAALSGAVLLIGLGLSSATSVLFPYPATKPGDSAFTQPQTSGASAALIQALSILAIIVLASPVLVFFVLGLTVNPFWLGVVPVAAALIGFAAFASGVWAGAHAFRRRGPELVAFAVRND